MELARIVDHIIGDTVIAVDTGALTGFTYVFQWRELIYEIHEEIYGGTVDYEYRSSADWKEILPLLPGQSLKISGWISKVLAEFENLVTRKLHLHGSKFLVSAPYRQSVLWITVSGDLISVPQGRLMLESLSLQQLRRF